MMLQDFIHKITEGSGARFLKWLATIFALLTLAVWYDLAAFKNLSTQEGMDAAQLARRIADGHGYTTDFVRPFSMYLVRRHRADGDALVRGGHPDLANAPLYPVLLAGALKIMPFPAPDLRRLPTFSVYLPDLWITGLNQALFAVAVWLLYRLARRLFDESVAWASVAVFVGSELFWRFSTSGQSTLLLVVLFLALASVLARIERHNERQGAIGSLMLLAGVAGALAGALCLTRYSFGLVVVAVLAFVGMQPVRGRAASIAVVGVTFLIVVGPWVARNWTLSGAPFGTATYALVSQTSSFPEATLERSQQPDFSDLTRNDIAAKLFSNLREIVRSDLPKLGGSWVSAFFLVGLLMPFRSVALTRLRWFTVLSLVLLALAQALGRTHLTGESPEINAENLLAVVAPLAFMFGVSLFFVLLEQLALPLSGRVALRGLALGLVGLPLVLTLLTPNRNALAFPPYFPPWLQAQGRLFQPGEWVMSDVPWALAWYGQRQSVWTSLRYRSTRERFRNDFASLHRIKPLNGLHFSVRTLRAMNTQPLWDWVNRSGQQPWDEMVEDWEGFILGGVLLQREVPTGFPLKRAPRGLLPEIFLTDSERKEAGAIQ